MPISLRKFDDQAAAGAADELFRQLSDAIRARPRCQDDINSVLSQFPTWKIRQSDFMDLPTMFVDVLPEDYALSKFEVYRGSGVWLVSCLNTRNSALLGFYRPQFIESLPN
jgi:hypothetical protein